jgi:hypothetical protein
VAAGPSPNAARLDRHPPRLVPHATTSAAVSLIRS